jgi:hypothetical protein
MHILLKFSPIFNCTSRIYLDVERWDTILHVKEAVSERRGIPVERIKITFRNKEFRDDFTMEQCNIEKEAELHYSERRIIPIKFKLVDNTVVEHEAFENSQQLEMCGSFGNIVSVIFNSHDKHKNLVTTAGSNQLKERVQEQYATLNSSSYAEYVATILKDIETDEDILQVNTPILDSEKQCEVTRKFIQSYIAPLIDGISLEIRKGRKARKSYELPNEIWKHIIGYVTPYLELCLQFRFWTIPQAPANYYLTMTAVSGHLALGCSLIMHSGILNDICFGNSYSIEKLLRQLQNRSFPVFMRCMRNPECMW